MITLPLADRTITEITCHARGAIALEPEARMVIDIGGQDSKVIAVDANALVAQFAMNDRCAAGTGKFLEVLARAVNIEIEEMGRAALAATDSVKITSMCATFAETEVIARQLTLYRGVTPLTTGIAKDADTTGTLLKQELSAMLEQRIDRQTRGRDAPVGIRQQADAHVRTPRHRAIVNARQCRGIRFIPLTFSRTIFKSHESPKLFFYKNRKRSNGFNVFSFQQFF
jgi:hypothetical protein